MSRLRTVFVFTLFLLESRNELDLRFLFTTGAILRVDVEDLVTLDHGVEVVFDTVTVFQFVLEVPAPDLN